ncbi:MAG: DMT family transporter [Rikenellaceae bacterium]
MLQPSSLIKYHLLAFVTIFVWGVTFISTKLLLNNGLTASSIFFYRFLIAYICIWFFCYKRLWCSNLRDELYCVVAGVSGGSFYYIAENSALEHTLASNVALIIALAPLMVTLLTRLFVDRAARIRLSTIAGSVVAFGGVALVVFNGSFILELNPLGDLLSFLAALMWAIYCLVVRNLDGKYSTIFITRKIFFYGLLTLLPYFCFEPLQIDLGVLLRAEVLFNLLFLGVMASLVCYITWTICITKLGALRCTTYIYFLPLVTLLVSWLILDEKITVVGGSGAALILCGIYWAQKSRHSSSGSNNS